MFRCSDRETHIWMVSIGFNLWTLNPETATDQFRFIYKLQDNENQPKIHETNWVKNSICQSSVDSRRRAIAAMATARGPLFNKRKTCWKYPVLLNSSQEKRLFICCVKQNPLTSLRSWYLNVWRDIGSGFKSVFLRRTTNHRLRTLSLFAQSG